jgi:TM2 domain-containing membrane protein YozV
MTTEINNTECRACGDYQGRSWIQEIKYACPNCETKVSANEKDFPKGKGTGIYLLCPSCRGSLHIPSSVWCPVCGNGLQKHDKILECIAKENDIDIEKLKRDGEEQVMSASQLEAFLDRMPNLSLFGTPEKTSTKSDADIIATKPVVQQPPQPQPSRPITTSTPASISNKSPLLAAVLSLILFGGIGQIYLGQWKKGLTLIITNFLLNTCLTLFLPIRIPLISILGVGDAYGTAQEMEKGNSAGEWKFNVNWKVAGVAFLIYALREIIFLVIRKSSG